MYFCYVTLEFMKIEYVFCVANMSIVSLFKIFHNSAVKVVFLINLRIHIYMIFKKANYTKYKIRKIISFVACCQL